MVNKALNTHNSPFTTQYRETVQSNKANQCVVDLPYHISTFISYTLSIIRIHRSGISFLQAVK